MRVVLPFPQRSSAAPLALVYAALVLYASLYPFTSWRWPPGPSIGALVLLPWPPWRDPFDVWSNVLGYVEGSDPRPSVVIKVFMVVDIARHKISGTPARKVRLESKVPLM